jgi:putative intracellular protease/amidase
MNRILMVVSSRDRLGDSETPTGAWLEELAAPYWSFVDAGCRVDIASPRGGAAPLDPMSLAEPWLTADGARFLADSTARTKLQASIATCDVAARDYDAIFLVGGVATAWDFPADAGIRAAVESLYTAGRPVAGVCHGVLGLTGARDASGRPIVAGRAVTGVSNAEEVATGFDRVVPVFPQDRLTELGGRYSCAAPFEARVCVDGLVLTGQNPASAKPLAGAVLTCLAMGTASAAAR